MRKWILFIALIYLPAMAHAQGACPSSAPVTGNHCYFIAANGSDSNGGTSEATPWLHAPGMPNCSGTCATVQSSWGSHGNTPMSLGGVGLIFRGGDTWHFGNSGAGPYTGGTWNIWWSGNTSCAYETGERNCFYIGVDQTWYSGSSWARPILNGDNTPSTSLVSSCSYSTGSANTFLSLASNNNTYLILDSFEFTGLCSNDTANQCSNAGCSVYTSDNGSCSSGCVGVVIKRNLYMHGWTTTTAIPSTNSAPCTLMAGGGIEAWDHLVVDGSDS